MIKRDGRRFFVKIYNPKPCWKLLGVVITINSDGSKAFCTHIKIPDKHFYIKGQGYPINKELLLMLYKAKIDYIVIPEDGKRGFKTYIVETKKYLDGEEISEPLTERQRYIPLIFCDIINIDVWKLKKTLYT